MILGWLVLAGCLFSTQEVPSHDIPEASVWRSKKSGWALLKDGEQEQVMQFAEDYKKFMSAARTPATTVSEGIRLAQQAGFRALEPGARLKPGEHVWIGNRGRALIVAVLGRQPIEDGVRMVATHIDSPLIEMKARPLFQAHGLVLSKTINHGGIKNYQWANRPLALIGRVDRKDGATIPISIGLRSGDPVFLIPDLEPHDDQDLRKRTYEEVLKAEELNPVVGSAPSEKGGPLAAILGRLLAEYHIDEEDLVSAELEFVPASAPADVGLDRSLVAATGQDDRLSSYVALRAALALTAAPEKTALVYWTNNEETGSNNNTGAQSDWVQFALEELARATGPAESALARAHASLPRSEVVSADTNAGINPIFPTAQELTNAARLGYGVAIKRYGRGFDANSEFTARFRRLFDSHGIPWQTATYRADLRGGGTVGLFFSRRDMEVIDLGVPLLSMHAPVEASSKVDLWNFYRALRVFLEQ